MTDRIGLFQRALLDWFAATSRELPWRRTRDPWAILVSELMLQQTQVARVIPKWEAFLQRFPNAAACAAAPAGDVITMWAGLGYNRRALNLHRAARAVVADHGGVLPRTLPELLALPGIGPYTARAVMAFAYEADEAVVDTNAARVLARAIAGAPLDRKNVQALADATVPIGEGWAWNSAMLDLGAVICQKRTPRCADCPLASHCEWSRNGLAAPDPALGTAGVSTPQSTFEGSDRQGRGRIVAALLHGPINVDDLPTVAGWPDDAVRTDRVVSTLLADGLAVQSGLTLVLPNEVGEVPS